MFENLWVNKYAPQSISEYICNESLKKDLLQFIEDKNIPHLLLASKAGFGKTSLAKLLVKELNAECLYLNSSLNRSIDDVREKIVTFASTYSFDAVKIVILDEADGMTIQALESLKGVIEKYSEHVRFIFTTNQIDKIPEPLWSRCQIYNLENAPLKEVGQRCLNILREENITFDKQDLVNLIKYYHPDIRKTIDSLELCSKTGTLIFDPSKVSKDYFSEILNLINSKEKLEDKFYKIRQIILDNDLKNLDQLYSQFFQNIKQFSKGHDCEITIALADALHKSVTIPDKELNLMACISEILTITK